MNDYAKHQARTAARTEREVATRATQFRELDSADLRAKLRHATPWERAAIRRVLRERGEE